jgi:polyisoprenoid-binding protein YceI
MGESQIKGGNGRVTVPQRKKSVFVNGGKNMTTQSETTATTRSIWKLDPNHTLVEFSGKHMMFTTVKGHFKNVNGTIVLDEADPSRSSVEVEIDASTLYSGVERRDTHLKSPDFLDIQNYSVITFKSTRVEPESNDHAKVIGDLTIRGVTREVVLDTELTGRGKMPMPGAPETVGFEARTQINRKDFGLNWNVALETGGLLVGDIIKIEIAVEAHKQS